MVCQTGRPEIATDPMGVEQTDIFVDPEAARGVDHGADREELVEAIDEALDASVPGRRLRLQPADRDARQRADRRRRVRRRRQHLRRRPRRRCGRRPSEVAGASCGRPGRRRREGRADRRAADAAHHRRPRRGSPATGSTPRTCSTWSTALGRAHASARSSRGKRRFDIQVRLRAARRAHDPERDPRARDRRPRGPRRAARATLADVAMEEGPAQISRENGRSAASRSRPTCAAATSPASSPRRRRAVARKVSLPPGYCDRLGRPVREPADGDGAADDRRADRPGADLPAALR